MTQREEACQEFESSVFGFFRCYCARLEGLGMTTHVLQHLERDAIGSIWWYHEGHVHVLSLRIDWKHTII